MMRRRARVDANHAEIVKALRAIGASVQSLAALGRGVPDLLVAYRGSTVLLELKNGDKAPSATRLTPDQENWRAEWKGMMAIVYGPEEAIRAVEKMCVNRVAHLPWEL